jgi:outer membrane immunogenic protein
MINVKSEFDWSVAMRRFLFAAAMMGAVSTAHAADLPILRGGITDPLSSTSVNWQGFYVGGQYGYGSSDANLSGTNQGMTAALLANTTIESELGVSQWPLTLGKTSVQTSAYGGFVGYNWQWTEAVLSAEMSYMHGSFGGTSSASMSRLFSTALSDGFFHAVTSSSSSSISISDMATFRGRAGYAYGSFLPYAFAGVALGSADITRTVNVIDEYSPTLAPLLTTGCPNSSAVPVCASLSATNAQHNHLVYGYSAGLGMDVNLIGGLFLRGEWEYVRFVDQIEVNINTVRAGLGYKF